jgi:hypothetical protein
MPHIGIVESFFLIFSGAAILATLALYSKQPMLVAYIALGCLLGPFGFEWVTDAALLSRLSIRSCGSISENPASLRQTLIGRAAIARDQIDRRHNRRQACTEVMLQS